MVGLVVTPTTVPPATIRSRSPDCSKDRLRSSSQTATPELAKRVNEFIDVFPIVMCREPNMSSQQPPPFAITDLTFERLNRSCVFYARGYDWPSERPLIDRVRARCPGQCAREQDD